MDDIFVSPISETALETIRQVGPQSKWHDAKLIELALERRIRRWKDLKRPGFQDAECHVCLPGERHDNDGHRIQRQKDRLFLVYTRLQMFGDVVFDWEWRAGSETTGKLYDGQEFGELLDGTADD